MIRIVGNTVYSVEPADFHRLKAYDLGHGHVEFTASRGVQVHECDWTQEQISDYLALCAAHREENPEVYRERSIRKCASRARARVRRLCKAMGADHLLTLTYRANMQDLDILKKHLREFNRRCVRLMPGFCFVAGFERQDRGAWHAHLAIRKLPVVLPARGGAKVKSFNVLRAIWRSVVGDLQGNIDVARSKGKHDRPAARIAAYIAKYITKGYAEGERWSNRWTSYGKVEVPPPVELGTFSHLGDLLAACYSLMRETAEVDRMRLDKWHDWVFISAQESPPGAS